MQCHHSIERIRLAIGLSDKLCVNLVPFSRFGEFTVESRKMFIPRLHLAPLLEVTPFGFRQDLVPKNESLGYRCVVCVTARLAVLM